MLRIVEVLADELTEQGRGRAKQHEHRREARNEEE